MDIDEQLSDIREFLDHVGSQDGDYCDHDFYEALKHIKFLLKLIGED